MSQSESIVLFKRPLREADLLVTFFSRADGKMTGVARSAKKSQKRFGGLLESGYVIDLHYSTRSGSDLANILEASLISPKLHKEKTLASSTALWFALELASRFLPEGESSPEKFELLKRFVTAFHEDRLSRPILIFFLFQWIVLTGYLPDLHSCAKCGHGQDRLIAFSSALGGFLCESCASKMNQGYRFQQESIGVLRRVVSGDMRCDIRDPEFEDLLKFVFDYSTTLLGRSLKVKAYLPLLMETRTS